MKKMIALCLALPLCAVLARAGEHPNWRSSTVTMNDDSASDDCRDHLRVGNDEYRASVRDEEIKTIPNQPLTITAEHNGGIQVTTWDKPEVSLKLCKQIAVDDENEGRRLLADTRLEINGSKISVHAPEEDHHSLGTVLLVKAPQERGLKSQRPERWGVINQLHGHGGSTRGKWRHLFQAQHRKTDGTGTKWRHFHQGLRRRCERQSGKRWTITRFG